MTRSRRRTDASALISLLLDPGLLLDLQIFEGCRVREAPDQVDPRLLRARAHAPDEGELVDRDVSHPLVKDALDLVEQGLAFLGIRLARLALEQVLDVGHDSRRVDAIPAHVGLE